MNEDGEGIFGRLMEQITDRFGFIAPVRIIRRTETLTILDYRPTLIMFLSVAGFLGLSAYFGYEAFKYLTDDARDSYLLWFTGIPAAACLLLSLRYTVREVYHFDKTGDSYTFVRQFIHRREVTEGAVSQFAGAYVKSVDSDDGTSYFVMLRQEGMFLTGVSEQTLREEVPIFNSFDKEAEIANAVSSFLPSRKAAVSRKREPSPTDG